VVTTFIGNATEILENELVEDVTNLQILQSDLGHLQSWIMINF